MMETITLVNDSYTIYNDKIKQKEAEATALIRKFVNITTEQQIDRIVFGKIFHFDEAGDLRRLIPMLIMISIERELCAAFGEAQSYEYFQDKYELEAYRDYLGCRGIPSVLVDQIFSIFGLKYSLILTAAGETSLVDAGIGDMVIEGDPIFKIY